MRLAFGTIAVAAVLLGCSSAPAESASTLDDTSWRLIEIQSMDDEQGTTTVPEGETYTVVFGGRVDGVGRASFQIACNRGSSSWEATPGVSGTSGELTFGPIATTRMACLSASLDHRVATALAGVRSYLIEDGRLHLSLLADAGILTWEPWQA